MNLPKSKRRQIRDIVLARLTADGTPLRRFVKTWQLFQGKPNETAEWTAAMTPILRVSWTGGPMSWAAESLHKASLGMSVSIGVAGTNQGDLMDFWEAVEGVLFSCSDPHGLLKALQVDPNLGVQSVAIEQPAISDRQFSPGELAQQATGLIRIRHHVITA